MAESGLSFRNILKRTAGHVAGAVTAGIVFGLTRTPKLAVGAVIGAIVFKEAFLDPHPRAGFWYKSVLDTAIWTGAILGARKLAQKKAGK